MALGRNIIINWLIKSKAIKDDERELYEYALNSMVLLLSPAIISITIGCIMGIPVNGIFMVMPFLFLRKFSGGYHARHAWTCFVGSSILVTLFLWISTKINSGILLYVVTVISVVELCVFSPIQSGNRNIEGKEKYIYKKVVMSQLAIYIIAAIMAYIFKKEIFSICIFLGIILTSIMQLPSVIKIFICWRILHEKGKTNEESINIINGIMYDDTNVNTSYGGDK